MKSAKPDSVLLAEVMECYVTVSHIAALERAIHIAKLIERGLVIVPPPSEVPAND